MRPVLSPVMHIMLFLLEIRFWLCFHLHLLLLNKFEGTDERAPILGSSLQTPSKVGRCWGFWLAQTLHPPESQEESNLIGSRFFFRKLLVCPHSGSMQTQEVLFGFTSILWQCNTSNFLGTWEWLEFVRRFCHWYSASLTEKLIIFLIFSYFKYQWESLWLKFCACLIVSLW